MRHLKNARLLKEILEVQTVSGREDRMVDFITRYCRKLSTPTNRISVNFDMHNNVLVTKGDAQAYPVAAAHIDTVHPLKHVAIHREGDFYYGTVPGTKVRRGIGGDCKTGVFVCLELLRTVKNIKLVFLAQEECGCVGASRVSSEWFKDVGYIIEFDCPSKNLMSYSSSGVTLFDNQGDFIKAALPVLDSYKVEWQAHPITDVSVLRSRFKLNCLNLSSGYYNWHMNTEYVKLSDVANAVDMATKLFRSLGCRHYAQHAYSAKSLRPVGGLRVTQSSSPGVLATPLSRSPERFRDFFGLGPFLR